MEVHCMLTHPVRGTPPPSLLLPNVHYSFPQGHPSSHAPTFVVFQ